MTDAATVAISQAVASLVARFAEHIEEYRSGKYNETQLRREFLDPFWKALGWDVDNTQGYAWAYRDVIHEDEVKVEGSTKAPDYGFRIGQTLKFFLEAKKPKVVIKTEIPPAYQLRRYAWNAKLALSVLSDFEEFAVYDARVRPSPKDDASTARVFYCRFDEYAKHWDWIYSTFSKEAVLKGAFDKYAESKTKKRGTTAVDDAFLEDIESWRKALATNLALRNARLTQRQLNFAVQRIIDRIIFLRICEDRGIEKTGRLQAIAETSDVYGKLTRMFREADDRYNSGLFHFTRERERGEEPDELTLRLKVDDKVLRDILRGLYYPQSPYEFKVFPADILGQVYERFLGKTIRLTDGHQAKVEEKPEVRKAGGVYYTPTYIVEYIVKNTVGVLLGSGPQGSGSISAEKGTVSQGSGSISQSHREIVPDPLKVGGDNVVRRGTGTISGKAPKLSQSPSQAAKLKILDPACGSGSFLIGAYQYLLDWHLDWYSKNDPQKWSRGKNPTIYEIGPSTGSGQGWALTLAERKRILIDNIFGVDIDSQAVEVTKLSLLLKVLEGQTEQTVEGQLKMFHERALPDLGRNIKCGNSLIGPDFYKQKSLGDFSEDERLRINVFDWNAEFPAIMKSGGFDAVIGNPPYVLLQDEFRNDDELAYFRKKFGSAAYKIDTYHLFIEQGLNVGAKGGRFAMITPANFLTNNHLDKLRRTLLDRSRIQHVLVVDGGVFEGISVDNAILVVGPQNSTRGDFEIVHAKPDGGALSLTGKTIISAEKVLADPHVLFTGSSGAASTGLWKRASAKAVPLGEIADINFGKQLRDRKKFVKDVIEVPSLRAVPKTHRPCYTGRDVHRYDLAWGKLACLDDEVARSGGCWDASRHDAKDKLVTRQIGRHPDFALDSNGWHCLNTMFMVNVRPGTVGPRYVLGLLNSTLMHHLWEERFFDQRRTFPKIKGTYLKLLPIRSIDFANKSDKTAHDKMVALVEQMLDLNKKLPAAHGHEKTALERQIAATDNEIDQLVYELYGLTPDEIKLVEGV